MLWRFDYNISAHFIAGIIAGITRTGTGRITNQIKVETASNWQRSTARTFLSFGKPGLVTSSAMDDRELVSILHPPRPG
jgi:hypothetical protein